MPFSLCQHRAFPLKVVHGTFDVTRTDERWDADGGADGGVVDGDGGGRFGLGARVVVIGRHLDRRKLERGLHAAVLRGDAAADRDAPAPSARAASELE